MTLALHFHPLSSYCHKVLIAFYENGAAFEQRLVNLGDPADRKRYLDLWPIGKIPILRDESRLCDFDIMTPMQKIVGDRIRPAGAQDPHGVADAVVMLRTVYGLFEQSLADRIWAGGDSFSIADCAAAPSLFFAETLVPFSGTHRNLSAYFERLVSRPSFARVLGEAKPWLQYYPFQDRIAARFR